MTPESIDPRAKDLVLQLLGEHEAGLLPTEIFNRLTDQQLTPTQIQTALAILLDTGVIEMEVDRRLHIAQVVA
jgi:hypothetical protein